MGRIIMQVIDQKIISGKKVLLRLDLDVALQLFQGKQVVAEDYKIRAGIPTLNLCIENASKVIIIGHLGRPEGQVVEELKVAPIIEWLRNQGYGGDLESGKLEVLENLRFDPREEACDLSFAKELAQVGDVLDSYTPKAELSQTRSVYINEAFSSYRPAASTTMLPTLLPHAAGLRFASEVEKLTEIRNNPKKPFIAIMGGAKVGDKVPVIKVLAQKADAVLVGGKLIAEIREQQVELPPNVLVGKLTEDGFDVAEETISAWKVMVNKAAQIVWNGPLGRISNSQFSISNLGSERGSYELAKAILETKAETIIGGGDIIAFLSKAGLLEQFQTHGFVSVGGGAMLAFLSDGTLPTIEVLK